MPCRFAIEEACQPGYARFAAETALSTSAASARATLFVCSPSAGSKTGEMRPLALSFVVPSIQC